MENLELERAKKLQSAILGTDRSIAVIYLAEVIRCQTDKIIQELSKHREKKAPSVPMTKDEYDKANDGPNFNDVNIGL